MKIGDKFKVISYTKKRPKVSQGIILSANEHSITIIKKNKYNEEFKESFCIGDLIDKYKKKYINSCGIWELITFEQRGNEIIPIENIKRDNTDSNV